MDEQHEEFVTHEKPPRIGIATVAVVSGEGMEDVFRSLGVTAIAAG